MRGSFLRKTSGVSSMKIEAVLYELKTLQTAAIDLTQDERQALREAIPIIKRCEKYRKALLEIDSKLYDPKTDDAAHMAQRIIAEAFDCEDM